MTSSRTYADFRQSSYFPSLNGVRAICALAVIKLHANWTLDGAPRMFDWGFLGVDMFFVISGFLIVTLLLRERDRCGQIDLKQFYLRRTRRIFPIYYLLIGLLLLFALGTYAHSTKTWDLYKWSFPVFALYLQDIVPVTMGVMYHTWSLPMEEQFYMLWPGVERFFRRSLIVPTLLVLLLVNQLCNFGFFDGLLTAVYGPGGPLRPMYLITFTPILLGVLAAHLMHDPRTGRPIAALLENRWIPLLLLSLAMLVCEHSKVFQGVDRLMVHILFCLALVAMVINPRGVMSKTLRSRVLSYLGSISYGIYLYHTFVLLGVNAACKRMQVVPTPFELFVVVTLIAIAVAAASFRFIEAPIMRRRHRERTPGMLAPAGPGV